MPRSARAPRNWIGPARTWSGWNAGWGHATTRPGQGQREDRRDHAGTAGRRLSQDRDRYRSRYRETHPHLEFDQDAIDAEAATDGWYALLTNLPADQADAAQVLVLYKGQEAVERRYSAFKGPLAVAALFCKNNRRIAALVTVICLALLIFCLIERQVRHSISEEGETTVEGLYAGRPAIPTGRLILNALAPMKIISGSGHGPPVIPQPTPLQLRLLDLLGIDPRQLR